MSSVSAENPAETFAARLQDEQEDVRLVALAELLDAGDEAAVVVEEIAERLLDDSQAVRQMAVAVLGQLGAPAVAALTQGLDKQQEPPIRIAAANGLVRAGVDAEPAIPQLEACLAEEDDVLRFHGALALSKIGRPAIPALLKALESDNPPTQIAAADALGWIGTDAKEAIEPLKGLSAAKPSAVSLAAAKALVSITEDPSTGVPALLTALEADDAEVRTIAVERLGELRDTVAEHQPAVRERLKDDAPEVRAASALALARIGVADDETLKTLSIAAGDADADVQSNVAIAFGTLKPDTAETQSE